MTDGGHTLQEILVAHRSNTEKRRRKQIADLADLIGVEVKDELVPMQIVFELMDKVAESAYDTGYEVGTMLKEDHLDE